MTPKTQHRLRKHPDYQRVYKDARKQWAKRRETTGARCGLSVPKALGKAVDRNRIKRRLRALVRTALPLLGPLPVDVVLHPKRSVLEADFGALEREVALIFKSVRARHAAVAERAASTQAIPPPPAGDAPR